MEESSKLQLPAEEASVLRVEKAAMQKLVVSKHGKTHSKKHGISLIHTIGLGFAALTF